MADDSMKLELILLGKDLLGRILGKDIGMLKNFKKEGDAAAKSADKLDAARKKSAGAANGAANASKKETAETKKLGSETEKAAKAEEKLDKARKKRKGSDGKTKEEIADKTKLANATEKAAKAEEKLNNAKRRKRTNQSSMIDDAVLAGAGTTGFWLSKEGMSAAMSKQEALSDLYTAFYRGNAPTAEFNSQMLQAEQIADRLGNKLPGTTADFLRLFETMKQRGIGAKIILEGAGDAAANLAVANKEDVLETGANIARFGQMFNLKTRDEYLGAADLMSRAKTTYGITSSELMEAVKDFSGRTGKGLGLDGGKGAEDSLRFLAFLRAKTGMEGLTVGNAASSFFNQYLQAKQKKKDPTEELKKLTGVDLKIFDDKGKFLGLENAVKEFSKLKGKLSDEKMVGFGNALAGEEGASVFQAMVNNGDQWGAFNQEMTNSISLMNKSAKNAETFSNKIEALTGSLQNLGAAGFTPMLKPLGDLTDKTNDWVGGLTEAAKANPNIARMATTIGLVASAFLAFKGGSGLLSKFGGDVTSSFTTAWKSADTFKGKLGALKNFAANPITVSLQIMAAGMTIDHILKVFEEVRDRNKQLEENNKSLREQYENLMGSGKLFNYSGETGQNRKELDTFADKVLETMKMGRSLEFALQPERAGLFEHFWTSQRPYAPQTGWGSTKIGDNFTTPFSPDIAADMWKKSDVTAGFRDPNVLARLLARIESGGGDMKLNDSAIKLLESAIEKVAGTEKTQQARQILSDERRNTQMPGGLFNFSQFWNPLQQNTKQTTQTFGQLQQPANNLTQGLSGLSGQVSPLGNSFSGLNTNVSGSAASINQMTSAAQNFASRVNSLEMKPPTFGTINIPGVPSANPVANPFGFTNRFRAKGGGVSRNSPYFVGEKGMEMFVPNTSGSIVSNDILRSRSASNSTAQNITFSPTIIINSDNPNDLREAVNEVKREFAIWASEVKEELNPDKLARRVVFAADRDTERV